jgi:hypothetical protein
MSYWLMKSEPDEFSIDDLVKAPRKTTPWFGVRNYVARNFMRDTMRVGDGVLFYHSSCEVPGIAGLATVASTPYPDDSQFDKRVPTTTRRPRGIAALDARRREARPQDPPHAARGDAHVCRARRHGDVEGAATGSRSRP